MVLEQILKSIKLLHYKLLKFNFNLRKITFINFKQNKKKQNKLIFQLFVILSIKIVKISTYNIP